MKIHNNKIFKAIFPEMAVFLLDKSRFEVYYLHLNSENKPMVLLNKDNMHTYIDKVIQDRKNDIGGGMLFMCVGKLPDFDITISTYNNKINITESYDDYRYLRWE